jgi:phosphatidylglycerophosphatase A
MAASNKQNVSRRLALSLATLGWAGYAPSARGTVGTLLAIPLFPALAALREPSLAGYLIALALILLGSVWTASVASEELGERDSPHIVIDEVAGFVVATAFLDFSWSATAVAFCLFRLFDIAKPFPVSWVDRNVHGGLGVVGDDLAAGILAGLATRIVLAFI